MPIYDFECVECGTTFDEIIKSSDKVVTCPGCGNIISINFKLPTYAPNFKVVNGEISRHKRKYGKSGYADKNKHLDSSDNGVKFDVIQKRKL